MYAVITPTWGARGGLSTAITEDESGIAPYLYGTEAEAEGDIDEDGEDFAAKVRVDGEFLVILDPAGKEIDRFDWVAAVGESYGRMSAKVRLVRLSASPII